MKQGQLFAYFFVGIQPGTPIVLRDIELDAKIEAGVVEKAQPGFD